MSIDDNPNKSQNEDIREEIPEGIGYGSDKDTSFDAMREYAESLNKEGNSKKPDNTKN